MPEGSQFNSAGDHFDDARSGWGVPEESGGAFDGELLHDASGDWVEAAEEEDVAGDDGARESRAGGASSLPSSMAHLQNGGRPSFEEEDECGRGSSDGLAAPGVRRREAEGLERTRREPEDEEDEENEGEEEDGEVGEEARREEARLEEERREEEERQARKREESRLARLKEVRREREAKALREKKARLAEATRRAAESQQPPQPLQPLPPLQPSPPPPQQQPPPLPPDQQAEGSAGNGSGGQRIPQYDGSGDVDEEDVGAEHVAQADAVAKPSKRTRHVAFAEASGVGCVPGGTAPLSEEPSSAGGRAYSDGGAGERGESDSCVAWKRREAAQEKRREEKRREESDSCVAAAASLAGSHAGSHAAAGLQGSAADDDVSMQGSGAGCSCSSEGGGQQGSGAEGNLTASSGRGSSGGVADTDAVERVPSPRIASPKYDNYQDLHLARCRQGDDRGSDDEEEVPDPRAYKPT